MLASGLGLLLLHKETWVSNCLQRSWWVKISTRSPLKRQKKGFLCNNRNIFGPVYCHVFLLFLTMHWRDDKVKVAKRNEAMISWYEHLFKFYFLLLAVGPPLSVKYSLMNFELSPMKCAMKSYKCQYFDSSVVLLISWQIAWARKAAVRRLTRA